MENECKKYLSTGPLNFIIVLRSDRGGLGPLWIRAWWKVLQEAFGGKDVGLKIVPPKTTKYAQPLDVYFFRQYEIYAKKITDFIKLRFSIMQPKLLDRFLIIKLHSVIYNELSAEAHIPMLLYECRTLTTIAVDLWITSKVWLKWRSALLL